MCCKNQVFFWYKKRTYKAYLPFLLLRDIHGFLGGNVPHGIFANVHAKKSPSWRGFFIRTVLGVRYPRTAWLRRFQSYDL